MTGARTLLVLLRFSSSDHADISFSPRRWSSLICSRIPHSSFEPVSIARQKKFYFYFNTIARWKNHLKVITFLIAKVLCRIYLKYDKYCIMSVDSIGLIQCVENCVILIFAKPNQRVEIGKDISYEICHYIISIIILNYKSFFSWYVKNIPFLSLLNFSYNSFIIFLLCLSPEFWNVIKYL